MLSAREIEDIPAYYSTSMTQLWIITDYMMAYD